MSPARFDLGALFRSLDEERGRRALSWAALSRQVGVATSTIRRYGDADDAEADGVLAAVRWLGVAPEDYVTGVPMTAESLLPPGEGYVRVDMELIIEGAFASGRTRTSIQRLVEAAQRSRRPIAALTRHSET